MNWRIWTGFNITPVKHIYKGLLCQSKIVANQAFGFYSRYVSWLEQHLLGQLTTVLFLMISVWWPSLWVKVWETWKLWERFVFWDRYVWCLVYQVSYRYIVVISCQVVISNCVYNCVFPHHGHGQLSQIGNSVFMLVGKIGVKGSLPRRFLFCTPQLRWCCRIFPKQKGDGNYFVYFWNSSKKWKKQNNNLLYFLVLCDTCLKNRTKYTPSIYSFLSIILNFLKGGTCFWSGPNYYSGWVASIAESFPFRLRAITEKFAIKNTTCITIIIIIFFKCPLKKICCSYGQFY